MFNIGYFKGQPTDYIFKYASGRLIAEGPGLAFYFFKHNTQIVAVPIGSTDVNFVFNELTNNFQAVTLQGQLTYRIVDPKKATAALNFAINPVQGAYLSDDPVKLAGRLSNIIQIATHSEIQKRTLEETLRDAQAISALILAQLRQQPGELQTLGVELLSVYFLSTCPTPEVAKALEAEYRETLLRKADEAIYARRASAIEEEHKLRAKQLDSDKTIEEQRRALIVLQVENALQEADGRGRALEREAQFRAKAAELELAVYKTLESRQLLAYAMKELGQNAGKIGNLTITSEMLSTLLNGTAGGQ